MYKHKSHLLASPKSIIFTWWPEWLTRRMFSGWKKVMNCYTFPDDIPVSIKAYAIISLNPLRKEQNHYAKSNRTTWLFFCFICYLEVQVKYIHLVHVLDTLTDLFHKHHGIHLSQRTALIHDSLKQLTSLHTESKRQRSRLFHMPWCTLASFIA